MGPRSGSGSHLDAFRRHQVVFPAALGPSTTTIIGSSCYDLGSLTVPERWVGPTAVQTSTRVRLLVGGGPLLI